MFSRTHFIYNMALVSGPNRVKSPLMAFLCSIIYRPLNKSLALLSHLRTTPQTRNILSTPTLLRNKKKRKLPN